MGTLWGRNRGPEKQVHPKKYFSPAPDRCLSVQPRPGQGAGAITGPPGNQGGGSYLDKARPCLSSCGCRSARRMPASTVTCFFSVSTCKRPAEIGMS